MAVANGTGDVEGRMMERLSSGRADTAFLNDLALSSPGAADKNGASMQAVAAELLHQREELAELQFRQEVQREKHPTLSLHQAATW